MLTQLPVSRLCSVRQNWLLRAVRKKKPVTKFLYPDQYERYSTRLPSPKFTNPPCLSTVYLPSLVPPTTTTLFHLPAFPYLAHSSLPLPSLSEIRPPPTTHPPLFFSSLSFLLSRPQEEEEEEEKLVNHLPFQPLWLFREEVVPRRSWRRNMRV